MNQYVHTSAPSHSQQAIGLTLLGYFIYSCSDTGVKYLSESYSTIQILFLTGVFGTITLTLLACLGIVKRAFVTRKYHLHILRGFLILLVAGCHIYGFSLGITLAEFYVLIFTLPFFATLLATIFLKEPTGVRHWLVILTGFAAVFMMAQPDIIGISKGTIAVMVGVMFSAVATLIIRLMGPNESGLLYSLFAHLFYIFGTLPFLPTSFIWPQPDHWMIFALTAIGSSVAAACVAAGFAKAYKTAIVAPLNYSQIIWGILFGWFFFNDVPRFSVLIGAAIIIAAGLYMMNIESSIKPIIRKGVPPSNM